jgi:hypothetical protein
MTVSTRQLSRRRRSCLEAFGRLVEAPPASYLEREHVRQGKGDVGDDSRGGPTMRMPRSHDRPPPDYYDAARVEWQCPMTDRHAGALILQQVAIHPDGWARWVADGHVMIGYVQARPLLCRPEGQPAVGRRREGLEDISMPLSTSRGGVIFHAKRCLGRQGLDGAQPCAGGSHGREARITDL